MPASVELGAVILTALGLEGVELTVFRVGIRSGGHALLVPDSAVMAAGTGRGVVGTGFGRISLTLGVILTALWVSWAKGTSLSPELSLTP